MKSNTNLSRRVLLRSLGAVAALPLMESLVPNALASTLEQRPVYSPIYAIAASEPLNLRRVP